MLSLCKVEGGIMPPIIQQVVYSLGSRLCCRGNVVRVQQVPAQRVDEAFMTQQVGGAGITGRGMRIAEGEVSLMSSCGRQDG